MASDERPNEFREIAAYIRKSTGQTVPNLPPVIGPSKELAEAQRRNLEAPPVSQEDMVKQLEASEAWRQREREKRKHSSPG